MQLFAASGSCFAKEKVIKGTVSGLTFRSDDFNDTMNSQQFWDNLANYAEKENAFILLLY